MGVAGEAISRSRKVNHDQLANASYFFNSLLGPAVE